MGGVKIFMKILGGGNATPTGFKHKYVWGQVVQLWAPIFFFGTVWVPLRQIKPGCVVPEALRFSVPHGVGVEGIPGPPQEPLVNSLRGVPFFYVLGEESQATSPSTPGIRP